MSNDFIGKLIDRKYRVLSVLGRGNMGVVYRAEQLDAEGRARRIVAVKTLKPELCNDPDPSLKTIDNWVAGVLCFFGFGIGVMNSAFGCNRSSHSFFMAAVITIILCEQKTRLI